jgi:hypothetical protein
MRRGFYCRSPPMQPAPVNVGGRLLIPVPGGGQTGGRERKEGPRDLWGRGAGASRSLLSLLDPQTRPAGAVRASEATPLPLEASSHRPDEE